MAVKKLRKRSGFVTVHEFTVIESDAKFQTRYMKGGSFVNRRYKKGGPILSKMEYKRLRVGPRAGASRHLSIPRGSKMCD